MFFHFFANTPNLSLCDYVSVAEQDHLIGDLIDFVQECDSR